MKRTADAMTSNNNETNATTAEELLRQGCTVGHQEEDNNNAIVSISTSTMPDHLRWQLESLPSFASFRTHLHTLDLYKNRYITSLEPAALSQLQHLTTLRLTRCGQLKRLPDSIGQLSQLQVVRTRTIERE